MSLKMSLAGTLMTPRIDAKIRYKLMKGKCKGTDFKDILRERFNNRIRENRRTLFDKIRCSQNTVAVEDTLSGYLANEMSEFRKYIRQNTPERFGFPLGCDDEYYDRELKELDNLHCEFIQEQLSKVVEEYRKEEEQIKTLMTDILVCPICKRGTLQKFSEQSSITCTECNLRLSPTTSIELLGAVLRQSLDEHSVGCFSDPQFILVNEIDSNSLLMICSSCSLFHALN